MCTSIPRHPCVLFCFVSFAQRQGLVSLVILKITPPSIFIYLFLIELLYWFFESSTSYTLIPFTSRSPIFFPYLCSTSPKENKTEQASKQKQEQNKTNLFTSSSFLPLQHLISCPGSIVSRVSHSTPFCPVSFTSNARWVSHWSHSWPRMGTQQRTFRKLTFLFLLSDSGITSYL